MARNLNFVSCKKFKKNYPKKVHVNKAILN